jgi:hypothetical protein
MARHDTHGLRTSSSSSDAPQPHVDAGPDAGFRAAIWGQMTLARSCPVFSRLPWWGRGSAIRSRHYVPRTAHPPPASDIAPGSPQPGQVTPASSLPPDADRRPRSVLINSSSGTTWFTSASNVTSTARSFVPPNSTGEPLTVTGRLAKQPEPDPPTSPLGAVPIG